MLKFWWASYAFHLELFRDFVLHNLCLNTPVPRGYLTNLCPHNAKLFSIKYYSGLPIIIIFYIVVSNPENVYLYLICFFQVMSLLDEEQVTKFLKQNPQFVERFIKENFEKELLLHLINDSQVSKETTGELINRFLGETALVKIFRIICEHRV